MENKRIIAIVAGGDSSEHDVSLRSAEGIYSFMNKDKYDCHIVEIKGMSWQARLADGTKTPVDRNDFSWQTPAGRIRPDYAYITIHGTPGENGIIQGYFDLIHLPYSTSDVLVESMTFDKYVLNNYLRAQGVSLADSVLLRRGDNYDAQALLKRLGLPCFVKPAADGSSFGVSKVKTLSDLKPALELAFKESDEVMIESFLQGTEISQGVYKTRKTSVVLPATEVVTSNEFFDYNAKYNGQVQEITPARLSPATSEAVARETSRIYDILHANGIIRVDYIISHDAAGDHINMLEINTTPGMTATSFIPQQVRAAGLDMGDVLSQIIENQF